MFKKEEVAKAKEEFKTLKLDGDLRLMINAYASALSKELDIKAIALKGFCNRAIRNFQIQEKKYLTDFKESPLSIKYELVDTINGYVVKEFTRVLVSENDEGKLKYSSYARCILRTYRY